MKYQVKSQCVAGIGADINDSPLDPQLLVLGYVIQQMTSAPKAGIGRPPPMILSYYEVLGCLTLCEYLQTEYVQ